MWATQGCRAAGSQTFLELPGNPLATKRGKCGAVYDALCNRRDEFLRRKTELLLLIVSEKQNRKKEWIDEACVSLWLHVSCIINLLFHTRPCGFYLTSQMVLQIHKQLIHAGVFSCRSALTVRCRVAFSEAMRTSGESVGGFFKPHLKAWGALSSG